MTAKTLRFSNRIYAYLTTADSKEGATRVVRKLRNNGHAARMGSKERDGRIPVYCIFDGLHPLFDRYQEPRCPQDRQR